MKTIIAGSRSITNYEQFETILQTQYPHRISEIIQGGGSGTDALAKQFGEDYGIPVREVPADWNQYGKAAGPIRNKKMLTMADYCLVLWDTESKGTKNMIDLWLKKHGTKGLTVYIVKK